MDFIRNIKDSPHYERLKSSLQYKYDRRQAIGFMVIAVLCGLVTFLPVIFGAAEPDASFGILIIFFLILLGMWVYYTYRWLEIFLRIDRYIFFRARLDQPHLEASRFGSSVRFTVEFTDRQGKQCKRDTSPMFFSSAEPYFEDYNNKIVLAGYNEETDRLVVIQRLDA